MGPSQKIPLFLVFLISIGWTRGEEVSLSHYATYGKPCRDQCLKRESSYYWCATDDGWDYCSRTENTDYKYNRVETTIAVGNTAGVTPGVTTRLAAGATADYCSTR